MERGVLDTIYQVLRHPSDGLREATRDRPLAWALIVYAVVVVVWRIALLLGTPGKKTGILGSSGPLDVFLWAIVALLALFVAAAVFHVAARVFRGQGSYWGLVCALAFAALPVAFFAPLSVLDVLLGLPGFILYCLGWVALLVWAFGVLGIIAIRENYSFSTRRAMAAYFSPAVAVFSIFLFAFVVALCF
jgi:hypothetical protein